MSYIFVFKNEENKNLFIKDPKMYLKNLPRLDKNINISIIAPDGCKTKKIAKSLSQKYNLKIVNLEIILSSLKDIL